MKFENSVKKPKYAFRTTHTFKNEQEKNTRVHVRRVVQIPFFLRLEKIKNWLDNNNCTERYIGGGGAPCTAERRERRPSDRSYAGRAVGGRCQQMALARRRFSDDHRSRQVAHRFRDFRRAPCSTRTAADTLGARPIASVHRLRLHDRLRPSGTKEH